MEIVDTVYLVAYFRPSDPLHDEAQDILENLSADRKVSQAALIELDLLMKTRGLTPQERIQAWKILSLFITPDTVEPLTPLDIAAASHIADTSPIDYFDSLIAAQCILRAAEPLTTDPTIKETLRRRKTIQENLKKLGIQPTKTRKPTK